MKYAPQTDIEAVEDVAPWLNEADFQDAHVSVQKDGILWNDGIWKGGIWYGGIWKLGRWQDGTWYKGIWKGGVWNDGTWHMGTWESGRWRNGTWCNGTWESGTWEGGIWKDGFERVGRCRWPVYINPQKGIIMIGCKGKEISEWDEWFSSEEVYATKRDSHQFQDIYKTFLLAKAYLEIYKGLEK